MLETFVIVYEWLILDHGESTTDSLAIRYPNWEILSG